MAPDDQQLLSVSDVAKWLQLSPSWVRQHASGRRRPLLPSKKLGKSVRFERARVEEWLKTMDRCA